MRKVYLNFRRFASIFSGHGLRARFPWINFLYKFISSFLSPSKVSVKGHVLFLDREDSLGLAVNGEYEPLETDLIVRHVLASQVVLDIGANIGYFTLNFARLVGEYGKVYAFEPDPATFTLLRKNVTTNGYRNVILESVAVSNQSTRAYLQRDKFNNVDHRLVHESNSPEDLKVRSIRLDDYFASSDETIDFIKMDIQGAEILALEGMRQLLMRSRQLKLLTEFWPMGLEKIAGTRAPREYLELLDSLGFQFFEIDHAGSLLQRSQADLLAKYSSASGHYTNLLCTRKTAAST